MELELDNKLGTFYIQTTSWGPFYVQSLFYSFHLSLFWLPGTFECEIHSSLDISFHLIGCERNALLLTKRPKQRLAANFTDFADPRLTRDITGSLQGISLSLSGTGCYKNQGQFWRDIFSLSLNLPSLPCCWFKSSDVIGHFKTCANALWVRLNVKWEIGKCLPRPSF